MNNDIRLFINDQEIEFSKDPKILLNYKETELHNPTIVRNSFTKQIEIEGTNRNNDVFGHIWDLTRIQDGNFNPIKKTDFQLFVNDELFQKGYVKLDKVTRTNNSTKYSLTLYGGLGSFFYNLNYDQDDTSNNKKTLASLTFNAWDRDEPDLDFTIDKDNVYEAWGQIAGFGTISNPRWEVINFVPALNGIPGDFDASKVLINNNGLNQGGSSGFANGKTEGGITYRPVLFGTLSQYGYSLGEMPDDLHEWQTRDLRSYNQRPCVSMYRIIQACCDPINNGGYQVKLDSHFFHTNNPYYRDAWVTMPLLKDLEGVGGGENITITGATISTATTQQFGQNMYPVYFDTPSLVNINNVSMSVSVRFNPTNTSTSTYLYPHHTFNAKPTNILSETYVREVEINQGVIIQLFAIGQAGQVVGQSKAYLLGGQKNFNKKSKDPMWEYFYNPNPEGNDYGVEPEYEFIEGYFKKIGGSYTFVNMSGQKTVLNFSFSSPNNFSTLMMKIMTPRGEYVKYAFSRQTKSQNHDYRLPDLYSSKDYYTSGNYTLGNAYAQDMVDGKYGFVVESMEATGTDYEGLFSGTKITKERLLTTEYSPAEYLLSYCKMFGLYFYYDSTEDSDDPDIYPSGVVHIMDRDTFYTDEVLDLSKMIDWNKNVEITPAMAETKWYKFDTEHTESELDAAYKEQFGKDYGAQLVNTNYNFDSETTDLYDGNVFKTGIMCLEKDKYYKKTSLGLPVYQYNGLTYSLFYRTGTTDEFTTTEIEFPVSTTINMTSINSDYDFYDAFPKLQFHAEDNEPVDGSNVLVFFKGSVEAAADYWLTDDVSDMILLNDGSPCWLLTRSDEDGAGNKIAKKINYFPMFTRDLILFGREYGNIVHSWNFGHPQLIYSPDTYSTDGDAIYDVCWRDYIRDLYNVDTRKLTCYVKAEMDEKPWPYWLRRFYWFENSIWRLNEIKDLNVGSFETTKMEFIKVQDINSYKLDPIDYQGRNEVILDDTTLACQGGTITGRVYIQSAGGWYAGEYLSGIDTAGNYHYLDITQVMSPYSGRGEFVTEFTLTVPQNTGETPITWQLSIEDDFDNWYRASFVQDACEAESVLTITPSSRSVTAYSGLTTYTITAEHITGLTFNYTGGWFTAVRNGNTLQAIYQANQAPISRTGTITASGTGIDGQLTASATLVQAGGSLDVNTPLLEYDYNASGTSQTFRITTPGEWGTTINDGI